MITICGEYSHSPSLITSVNEFIMVSCPELAKPQVIITASNSNSLLLDTYQRSPGTRVTVSCLVPTGFELTGPSQLECNSTGSWNAEIPKCVLKTSFGNTDGDKNNGVDAKVNISNSDDLTMVPGLFPSHWLHSC
ncbi:hypothetical protein ScPMuIL_003029 [Solemya velum]